MLQIQTRKKAKRVYSTRFYKGCPKTTLSSSKEASDGSYTSIGDMIAIKYVATLKRQQEAISTKFKLIYGRDFIIPENKTSDIHRMLYKQPEIPIEEMCYKIQTALGYKTDFTRKVNEIIMPVSIESILETYELIKLGKPLTALENQLFLL